MPTKIEWCDETLNPFWGCTHGCWYCQARRIAHMRAERVGRQRGYPPDVIEKMKRFEPVWLPDAERILGQLYKWKKPRTIFVGFMGDIACLKRKNIEYIFEVTKFHLQHRFLILTKDTSIISLVPQLDIYSNLWVGYSDDGTRNERQWVYCSDIKNTFVSLEPLIDSRININPHIAKWLIIGALTDRRGKPVSPGHGGTRIEWVREVIKYVDAYNIPVFLKDNLLKLYPELPTRREFPW